MQRSRWRRRPGRPAASSAADRVRLQEPGRRRRRDADRQHGLEVDDVAAGNAVEVDDGAGTRGRELQEDRIAEPEASLPPPPTSVSLPSPVPAQPVVAVAAEQQVVRRADPSIVSSAGQPAQHVVADAAVDDVRERVPGAVDGAAVQHRGISMVEPRT